MLISKTIEVLSTKPEPFSYIMVEPINRVAESGIITIDPETFLPDKNDIAPFDVKDFLFMGLILKEKEFRESLKNIDTSSFQNKVLAVFCSADAIIPSWAYMLVAVTFKNICKDILMGTPDEVFRILLTKNIHSISTEAYAGKRIVIKGCGETPIPDYVYFELTASLLPVAKSIMYGEPCSTVPVYKKKD